MSIAPAQKLLAHLRMPAGAWRTLAGLVLVSLAIALCRAEDTGYRMKVALIAGNHMEAKFVQMPDDLRIACDGDPKGLSVGDYVKMEWKKDIATVGKMECRTMVWIH